MYLFLISIITVSLVTHFLKPPSPVLLSPWSLSSKHVVYQSTSTSRPPLRPPSSSGQATKKRKIIFPFAFRCKTGMLNFNN